MAIDENNYKVFSAEHSTNSLTKTGFKSTHYAIGELIDNSIQSALEDKKNKECNVIRIFCPNVCLIILLLCLYSLDKIESIVLASYTH